MVGRHLIYIFVSLGLVGRLFAAEPFHSDEGQDLFTGDSSLSEPQAEEDMTRPRFLDDLFSTDAEQTAAFDALRTLHKKGPQVRFKEVDSFLESLHLEKRSKILSNYGITDGKQLAQHLKLDSDSLAAKLLAIDFDKRKEASLRPSLLLARAKKIRAKGIKTVKELATVYAAIHLIQQFNQLYPFFKKAGLRKPEAFDQWLRLQSYLRLSEVSSSKSSAAAMDKAMQTMIDMWNRVPPRQLPSIRNWMKGLKRSMPGDPTIKLVSHTYDLLNHEQNSAGSPPPGIPRRYTHSYRRILPRLGHFFGRLASRFMMADFSSPIEDQGHTNQCLQYASTSLFEHLANRRRACSGKSNNSHKIDLSEGEFAYRGQGTSYGFNEFTDQPYIFKSNGLARRYGVEDFERKVLFSRPEGGPWADGGMTQAELDDMKKAMVEYHSPILFVYKPKTRGYWHADVCFGFDDKKWVPQWGYGALLCKDSAFGTPDGTGHRGYYELPYNLALTSGRHATVYYLPEDDPDRKGSGLLARRNCAADRAETVSFVR